MREALQRLLDQLRPALQLAFTSAPPLPVSGPEPISPYDRERRRGTKDQLTHQASRARRYELYSKIKNLQRQGRNILQVARELEISRQTVRRYFASAQFVELPQRPRPKSKIDPYVGYLQKRWDEGCQDMVKLWQELKEQGYTGSIRPIVQWTTLRRERLLGGPSGRGRPPLRKVEVFKVPSTETIKPLLFNTLPSSRQLVWLMLRSFSELSEAKLAIFEKLRTQPHFEKSYTLAQQFVKMVRERRPEALSPWVEECKASGISELANFATGLQREEGLIRAALEFAYSNGVSEGHVNRLKTIKRTMYGRASILARIKFRTHLVRKRLLMIYLP